MTDYLEVQAEEGVDALWEAARRLNDVLTQVEGREPDRFRALREQADPAGPAGEPEAAGEEERLPLLDAAEELDTAVARMGAGALAGNGRTVGRPGAGAARDLSAGGAGPNGAWPGGPEWQPAQGQSAPASVSPMSWGSENGRAERLDLLFRRDSRRYDGGFFLY